MDFPTPISPLQNQSSTPSSRTTSPSASPTTSHRQPTSPHHLFNLSFHPTSNPKDDETSSSSSRANPQTISVLPCAVLRGRSSMMLLRRRPSAVDMALSEERSRCDGNAIERQGLDLMEPRPVDMRVDVGSSLGGCMNATLAGNTNGNTFATVNRSASTNVGGRGFMSYQHRQSLKNQSSNSNMNQNQSQPPFVMGGIFEVMEGRA
ncbi:hypothetical protein N7478_001002 [Penicillium angulare]|uniref:uncharacterized protein n=1 Tax=Penicillium angulare TaxID=116970 RepID=UPI00253FDE6B|nr:uncharacterized protein N7478_001002 [Penicillium angulare]KAJ5291751.1 hypothetical protein N7478_001002 [Penicillium angulare]